MEFLYAFGYTAAGCVSHGKMKVFRWVIPEVELVMKTGDDLASLPHVFGYSRDLIDFCFHKNPYSSWGTKKPDFPDELKRLFFLRNSKIKKKCTCFSAPPKITRATRKGVVGRPRV